MSRRLTVRIPDDLSEGTALATQKLGLTPSEIVKTALREFLRIGAGQEYSAHRVSGLSGSLDSGIPDLAKRQREYILESLRNRV